jgi:hypothetical protein
MSFDGEELVAWAEMYGHPEEHLKKSQDLWGKLERVTAERNEIAETAMEVYGIVYAQLTDPERPFDGPEDRIAAAANEVRYAAINLEARRIFTASGLVTAKLTPPEGEAA